VGFGGFSNTFVSLVAVVAVGEFCRSLGLPKHMVVVAGVDLGSRSGLYVVRTGVCYALRGRVTFARLFKRIGVQSGLGRRTSTGKPSHWEPFSHRVIVSSIAEGGYLVLGCIVLPYIKVLQRNKESGSAVSGAADVATARCHCEAE
jgi:hypothetical protein